MTEPTMADAGLVDTGPDLAQIAYQAVGINQPEVTIQGHTTSIADIKPGDLVGWRGGYQPDGRYVGNIAVYVGNGDILESQFGQVRRRKLRAEENTFGLPVGLIGQEQVDI